MVCMKLFWARNVACQSGKSFTMKFTMRVKHYTDSTLFQNLETYKLAKDHCDIFRLGVFETCYGPVVALALGNNIDYGHLSRK